MGLPPYRVGSITVKAFIEDKFKYAAHQILRNDTVYDYREAEEVINSLFENRDIGTVTTSTKGRYKYALINGGQRVRAIKRFMADEFKIVAPTTKDLRKYSELCQEDREVFDGKKLILHNYHGLTDKQEAELYIHLNTSKPLSHGEFVRGTINVAPMCKLACELSDKYSDDLKSLSHVFGPRADVRQTSNSWTLIALLNFHHGQILYGRKLPYKKNKELCESLCDKPIDAETLTEQFDTLMRIISMKKTNLKYPSYVLATVQAIMLSNETYTAEQVNEFLYDMLVGTTACGDLRDKWDVLANTPGLDANLPASCSTRADIFNEWEDWTWDLEPVENPSDGDDDDDDTPIARLSESDDPPPKTDDIRPKTDFKIGDYIWVCTNEDVEAESDLAKIVGVNADSTEFKVEWWYTGLDMYEKIPGLGSIEFDGVHVNPWDLVLDNNINEKNSIELASIIGHASDDVVMYTVDEIRETWPKLDIDDDTVQRMDLMWTSKVPGRKQQYKVIDIITKKKMMKWSPTYDQRVFARGVLASKYPEWSTEVVEDCIKTMTRTSEDHRVFTQQLNTVCSWDVSEGKKRKRQ
jgi:hypothetical protein